MNTLVSKELISFGMSVPFSSLKKIVAGTGMQRELGVRGDDTIEFLVAYAKNFPVDVSHFMGAD